jgi:hypothetical protein
VLPLQHFARQRQRGGFFSTLKVGVTALRGCGQHYSEGAKLEQEVIQRV